MLAAQEKATTRKRENEGQASVQYRWLAYGQPDVQVAKEEVVEGPSTKRLKVADTVPMAAPTRKAALGAWFRPASQVVNEDVPLTASQEDDLPLSRVVQATQRSQVKTQSQQAQTKAPRTALRGMLKARPAHPSEAITTKGVVQAPQQCKATGKQRVETGEDGEVFELTSKRKVSVRKWKSMVMVDIREFYDDAGVSKPGKKGISLSKDQWETLLRLSRVVDEAIELVESDSVDTHSLDTAPGWVSAIPEERSIAFELSSKRRLTVRFFRSAVLVDLREYYEQGNEMKPGKKGISLAKDQWRSLQAIQSDISEALQNL